MPRFEIVVCAAIQLREENTVLLISQYRNKVPRWVGCLRLKMEARLVGRPIDRGSSAEERTLETLHAVVNLCRRDDPLHSTSNETIARTGATGAMSG